jgi:hypothetical protein
MTDSDPDHINPAANVADLVENRSDDIELADDQDPAELREFIEAAENGEFGKIGPGLESQIRMVKAVLDGNNGGGKESQGPNSSKNLLESEGDDPVSDEEEEDEDEHRGNVSTKSDGFGDTPPVGIWRWLPGGD